MKTHDNFPNERGSLIEWFWACEGQMMSLNVLPKRSAVEPNYLKVAWIPPIHIYVPKHLGTMPIDILMDYAEDGNRCLYTWDAKMRVIPLRGKTLTYVITRIREELNRGNAA